MVILKVNIKLKIKLNIQFLKLQESLIELNDLIINRNANLIIV